MTSVEGLRQTILEQEFAHQVARPVNTNTGELGTFIELNMVCMELA